MSETVLCSILSAAAVLCSSLIAYFTARHTARRELERQSAQWKREDAVDLKGTTVNFSTKLNAYLSRPKVPVFKNELMDAASAMRVVAPQAADQIDALVFNLRQGNYTAVETIGHQILSLLQSSP